MKLVKFGIPLLLLGLLIFGSMSCSGGGGSSTTPTDPAAAEAYIAQAEDFLEDGDLDSALGSYSAAVSADPNNGTGLLGYAILEVMSITVDPTMVDLARNHLGMADYPDNMSDLIEGTWIVCTDYQDSYDEWQEFYAPYITGEDDWADFSDDEDNPTDVVLHEEKALAAIEFFVTHNTGFNEMVDGMSSVMEDRITAALSAIDSIPSDAQIVFPGDATGINDATGENPQDIVVGKAEAQILAAFLLSFRSQVRMGQVYDYSLPLEDYWDFFWANEDYFTNSESTASMPDYSTLATPFAGTFLEADATAKLGLAKADMRDMISRLTGALGTIGGRTGSTYSLGPYSSFELDMEEDLTPLYMSEVWDDGVDTGIDFAVALFTEIDDSLAAAGGTSAVIPIPDMDYYDGDVSQWMTDCLMTWPSGTDFETSGEYSLEIDFGSFYASPLFAVNVIFDLENDGEPVFYKWNGSGGFTATTDVPAFDETDDFYYVKINDASFNNTIDVSIIPEDDVNSSAYTVQTINFSNDGDGDWLWDVGETIWDIDCQPNIEGVINLTSWNVAHSEEPAEFYWSDIDFTDSDQVSDDSLDEEIDIDASTTWTALRAYLATMTDDLEPEFNGPLAVLDGTAVYMALPKDANFLVAHSLTTEGTDLGVDLDEDGNNEYSTGSFWWGIIELLHMDTDK